ncbi:conserved hypothetical protein [Ricinus communis]|uniref:Uncharacterized protein n=1 Tax=Ricinus communis TaxID=3988 RepID=B9RHK2_RICCO|nr:conserved hypothetical protein [Ricinus communis]
MAKVRFGRRLVIRQSIIMEEYTEASQMVEVLQVLTVQLQAATVAPTATTIPVDNGTTSAAERMGTTPKNSVVLDFGQALDKDKNGINPYEFTNAEEEV